MVHKNYDRKVFMGTAMQPERFRKTAYLEVDEPVPMFTVRVNNRETQKEYSTAPITEADVVIIDKLLEQAHR